ncbi:MAG: hypothetical protein CSB55_03565 [Candidatus Cloacimonadota bacterium]|nr:MAG: hypothetical protein CSB55_03565 [Candidatus Cloacimonadota bacterium]
MKKLLIIVVLTVAFVLNAQDRIRLTVEKGPQPLFTYFYASSMDPDNPGGQIELFRVRMNAVSEPVPGDEYSLRMKLIWSGSDTPLIDLDNIRPAENGAAFPLTEEGVMIKSSDIITNKFSDLFYSGINFDEIMESNSDFEDIILESGMYPDGDYVIEISAYDNDSGQTVSNVIVFNFKIVNQSAISLVSPGRLLAQFPELVASPFPNFSWISNMSEFIFKIYEVEEGMMNQEEVENEEPLFVSEPIQSKNYNYPSQAPVLTEGKTYGWKIVHNFEYSDISQQPLESDMKFFKFSSAGNGNVNTDPIASIIATFNDPEFNELKELLLDGYNITDEINFMGEPVSPTELFQLLGQIINNEITVKSITIE